MGKGKLRYLDDRSYNELPTEFRTEKLEYHSLYNKIEKREKHLKKLKESYDEKRLELREWKKQRTERYNSLFELHETLIPQSLSISFSGSFGDTYSTRRWNESNNSWSITMRLKGKVFSPYIGTDKDVRLKLNEITNSDDYWGSGKSIESGRSQRIITNSQTEKKRMVDILKNYIAPNIIKFLVELNKDFDGYNEWNRLYIDKKIKGMDFLK